MKEIGKDSVLLTEGSLASINGLLRTFQLLDSYNQPENLRNIIISKLLHAHDLGDIEVILSSNLLPIETKISFLIKEKSPEMISTVATNIISRMMPVSIIAEGNDATQPTPIDHPPVPQTNRTLYRRNHTSPETIQPQPSSNLGFFDDSIVRSQSPITTIPRPSTPHPTERPSTSRNRTVARRNNTDPTHNKPHPQQLFRLPNDSIERDTVAPQYNK